MNFAERDNIVVGTLWKRVLNVNKGEQFNTKLNQWKHHAGSD